MEVDSDHDLGHCQLPVEDPGDELSRLQVADLRQVENADQVDACLFQEQEPLLEGG